MLSLFFHVSSAKERLIATISIVIRYFMFKSCCFPQISYYNLLDLSLLLGEKIMKAVFKQ